MVIFNLHWFLLTPAVLSFLVLSLLVFAVIRELLRVARLLANGPPLTTAPVTPWKGIGAAVNQNRPTSRLRPCTKEPQVFGGEANRLFVVVVCIYFDSQIQTGIEPNNMKANMKIIMRMRIQIL